ncbi:MAG: urease accessory protein UreD [Candidatus Rokubacteria bacterium]|nr:urease accessory protein UreD [Candidatus Rokubacteria bacterium]
MGRDGSLHLGFERRGPGTVLTERRFTLPLQALEPMDLDGTGVATLMLLNPTGGLLGGDRLDTVVSVGPGAHVCLTTPAATRVYRTAGAPAMQRLRATVGAGAALEYLPGHLIPSPGARLEQSTEIVLADEATAILLDAWAVGRVSRGEAWGFGALDIATVVSDPCGPLLVERVRLDAGDARRGWPGGLGGAEGMAYVATLAALSRSARDWGALVNDLRAALAAPGGEFRHGVTPLARGGVLARLLAPTAPALQGCVERLWALCRQRLLGLPPLDLRKL